jgi:hypothetical protein
MRGSLRTVCFAAMSAALLLCFAASTSNHDSKEILCASCRVLRSSAVWGPPLPFLQVAHALSPALSALPDARIVTADGKVEQILDQ